MNSVNAPLRNAGIAILALLATCTKGQAQTDPGRVNFCDVVASPSDFDKKLLSVEVTVQPSFHSLSLYSSACAPKEGFDVTTQAILPEGWESLPNGKKLRRSIGHGRPAKAQLVGTFRSSVERGQDGQRFRFSISKIVSVSPGESANR